MSPMKNTRGESIESGAEGGNRTHTLLPEPDFESGASTSSATPAKARQYKDSCAGRNNDEPRRCATMPRHARQ